MNSRQETLLKFITSEYIKTAVPVGSKLIAEVGNFDLSSATIRNEMAELENEGYIFQPHTSAGRVPSEKGYLFYVQNFLNDATLSKRQKETLDSAVSVENIFDNLLIKNLAKHISSFTAAAVFVAFSENDFYYTGISNLFEQPEFAEQQLVRHLGDVIDHLDLTINKIFDQLVDTVEISIGSKNPFSRDCSSVIAKYSAKDRTGIIGVLGPLRMDYQTNFSLIKYSQQLINNLK
ncbi:MAG: hypothetical protein PHW95_01205 [Patescibacteria group bacterium]|nr:hypothetical protein [Patescibacteria group bacterium]